METRRIVKGRSPCITKLYNIGRKTGSHGPSWSTACTRLTVSTILVVGIHNLFGHRFASDRVRTSRDEHLTVAERLTLGVTLPTACFVTRADSSYHYSGRYVGVQTRDHWRSTPDIGDGRRSHGNVVRYVAAIGRWQTT